MSEVRGLRGVEHFVSLKRFATETPESLALRAPGQRPLTYAKLEEAVQSARVELRNAGLQDDEVAVLVLPNTPTFITAFIAITGIGAGAPLNPALTESEFLDYLRRLRPSMLLLPAGVSSPAAAAAKALGVRMVRVHENPDDPAGVFTLSVEPGESPALPARKTDALLLMFTSATTGSPKLVPLSGANLRAMAAQDVKAFQLTAEDRLLNVAPLFHILGLAIVMTQLHCGGTVMITQGFHPKTFLPWLDEFRPTWFSSSPPMNHALLRLGREHGDFFRSLPVRFIRTMGETPEYEMLMALEQATGAPVLTGYGLTEAQGASRTTFSARKAKSAGRSTGMDLAIMNPSGEILLPDEEGEIVLRGPSVTSGYLDNPEANAATFRDGWFHTGDIGRIDSEGFLFITGRLKEMINRGGEKVLPPEVEKVLLAHPSVEDACAFGVRHPTLGEDVAAAVVLRADAEVTELELRHFCAISLAAFKVPRHIVFLDVLPRTSLGKLRRALLAQQFQNARTAQTAKA